MSAIKNLFRKILPAVLALFIACCVALSLIGCNDVRDYSGGNQDLIEQPDDSVNNNDNSDNNSDNNNDNDNSGNGDNNNNSGDNSDNNNDNNNQEGTGGEQAPELPDEGEEDREKELWEQTYDLPDSDYVLERLAEIYGGADKVFLLYSNTVYRFACPEDGEYININCMFTPEEYIRPVIEDCVAEFNYAFNVINPNYKFKLNFNPAESEISSRYKVTITTVDSFSSADTLGMASPYDNSIRIRKDVFNDGKKTMSVFKHELMHLFGAGDAYVSDKYTTDTIMQRYQINGPFSFSATDIAFIDTLYRNPENRYSGDYISEFLEHYTQNNPHTYEYNSTQALLKVMNGIDIDAVKEAVTELYVADEAAAVIKYLDEEGWSFNPDFGSVTVRFTDLTLKAYEDDTIHYSGEFDVSAGKYLHGTRKHSSNGTSSMSINYTDLGNGILFAAPNGTAGSTYFVQSGNYVFAFRCSGGFTDLSNYKMTLRRVNLIG